MQRSLIFLLLLVATPALANHHSWRIEEVFSNGDGTLQYIMMGSKVANDTSIACCSVFSDDLANGIEKIYNFPANLPGDSKDRYVLMATSAFAATYGLVPDYIIPDGFVATGAGAVQYNTLVDWTSLPTDGVTAYNVAGGEQTGQPINFAGQSVTLADSGDPTLLNVPAPLVVEDTQSVPGADARINAHFAEVACVDDLDGAPLLDVSVPVSIAIDQTRQVTLTCTDASGNTVTRNVAVTVSQFVDTDGDGISNLNDEDDDGDGTPDVNDAFPLDDSEALDTDNDGIGNNADADDDGDGVPDVDDAFPLDGSESVDTDNDGIGDNGDPDADGDGINDIEQDKEAPVISLTSPLIVDATGRRTAIDFSAVTASDNIDSDVTLRPSDAGPFRSGRHEITWTATDDAGNQATAQQVIEIHPILSLQADQVVAEVCCASIRLLLSGDAPAYPVSVDLAIGGTANDVTDYDVLPNRVAIESGREAVIRVNIQSDAIAEVDKTITVSLLDSSQSVIGPQASHTLTITEANLPPAVSVWFTQAGERRTLVARQDGMVEVVARFTDPNGDSLAYEMASPFSDSPITGMVVPPADVTLVTFDPLDEVAGSFRVQVSADDGELSNRHINRLVIVESISLRGDLDSDGDGTSDADEGVIDSDGDGIPDYLDDEADTGSLPVDGDRELATNPGYSLRLGGAARFNPNDASVTPAELARGLGVADGRDPGRRFPSGIVDFEVGGLARPGQAVDIVVPLTAPVSAASEWRKFDAATGWRAFVVDGANGLASAPGSVGACPAPGAPSWVSGLNEGDLCVRLTITDGGPNDQDLTANQVVADPGGLAEVDEPPLLTVTDTQIEAENAEGVSATSSALLSALASVGCVDTEDGDLEPVSNDLPVGPLAIGSYAIDYSCTDSSGTAVTGTFSLLIADTTAPELSLPDPIEIIADQPLADDDERLQSVLAEASCIDTVGGVLTVASTVPETLPFGVTSVTLACTDAAGNEASGQVAITVRSSVEVNPGDRGAGCFIATAAFGSYLDPHVTPLRRFRDETLLHSSHGRTLVRLYYQYSPPVADVIAASDGLRAVTRTLLAPVVFTVARPMDVLALSLLLLAAGFMVRYMRFNNRGGA